MASKFQFITELYSRTLTRLTGDYESWTGFLRSACYNYKCPFDEQVLIYAQRPDATAVLELEKWNRQFGRWVNAGATGIAVMDEARGKGRLKHYFDITDTHTTPASRAVPLWSMEESYTERVIETLEATFGTLAEKDNLPDAILSASRNAVTDNMQDYLRDLLDCRGGSMLEELDALNVEVTYRRALQSSVAYMLLTRLSLPAAAYILPENFEDIYSFDTPTTINALGIATSDIAEMGLREISRTVMQARREQFFAKDAQISYDAVKEQNNAEKERSAEHGSDLQSTGGLSPAEPAAAPRGGGTSGQVRGAAEAVHQEASQGAVYESQDQRSAGGTSGGDRRDSAADGDTGRGADGENRGRDGGTESRRSPALDGADEQPEAQRGGNGTERPDLQLNSTDENAGSAELPAFLDEHLIEAILLDDGGCKHTRQEIFAYFQDTRDIAARTEFLKNSYNDIWVEVLAGADKVRVGYHAEEDGLLMWEGSYLSRTVESVFSWGVVTEMTENLIERGAYKIKLGLQNAPVMAEQMSLFGMGGGRDGYDYTKTYKGLTYQREYAGKQYDEVKLSIPNVVKEYERLIAQKRFPGEDAVAKIPQYELRELARTVYFGFSDAPDDVPRPYPKGAGYYDAVPVIEEQLADKAKAAEMLEALTSYLDGMDEGDRHYDSCQQAREQLSEYVDGTFSLFNHRHDSGLRQAEREATPITPTGEVGVTEEPAQEQEISPLPQVQQREEKAPQGQAAMLPVPHLPRKKERLEAAAPLSAGGVNYRITDDGLGAAPPSQRYANNVAAIRLLKQVEAENRLATAAEQEVLSRYVGWGGLADCFDPKHSRYEELKGLLSETEYAAARESTLTAFYTPPVVIRSIYAALGQMGFRQGNVLEPACGVGHFLGMLPDSMTESKLYGVELDDVSGRIARQLYPRSSISVRGYEKMDFPDNFFDAAVGNVPFGQFKVQDRRYDRLNLSIHEYFFAKTLDKVRPGGVVAFVTSSYTMDKRTSNVRKYIAQRAELLGAIRLPNDTFKAAAGTEVVSDILFLQKRDRMVDIEPDWVQLGTNDDGITMNRYFIDHPDMVLGEMKMVSGPYGPEPTCVPFPEQPLDSLLANAVQNIHGEINAYDRAEELEGEDQSIAADPTVRNFSYTLVNDKLYYREDSRMNPVEVSKTAESRIRGMIDLRDCVRTLLEYQTEDYPDGMIRQQQAKLNDLYDRFTHDYGLINSRGNAIVFDQDSSYFLLCSLEVLDEEGGLKRKADLFTKRTIRSHRPAERVDTAVEALALSIGEKARVDMAYMGQLTGKDENTLFADLQGVVFLNPDYGERGGEKYLPADEYLSGNVRRKLAEVRTKAETEPQYLSNVEALEKVQPVDLTASEISVRLGATWLDPAYIRQFIFETLDTSRRARWDIKVHYSRITGEWRIEGKSKDSYNVKAYSTYGTSRASAYDIIESSLNLKDVRIFDYQYDPDGRRVAVLNKKETAIAQGKQELLKEAFAEWIWKDPERREKICKAYNILFNSNRPREYDGSHINFSGMNPEITLRKHQVNAIAHILYGGNTLLAHVVGAGKTFEMVAAAMESKRLGLCQKSLFVVPNHLTEQWASEFLQLYPAANVLVATKKDFETKNRKRFCGRIATGDYDAVIIGHSQFEKIPVSIQRQRAILEQQMDEIILGIQEAKNAHAENFTIKQMEKTRKGLQNKLDKLNDQSRKDDVVTFEELGVDRLFIDESHYYKNLFLYTKMRNVSGIAQTEAQKSSDLFMKCRYLDEITGGRGVVFATGTPISNSMVELYTIQRYLQMGALQEQGFQHFDAWAANYGETVTAIELAPEGTGYRAKTCFSKFNNLPELISVFKNVADIQTADMLNLPVPEAHYHNIALKPSEYQKQMVASLAERAEQVRNKQVDSSVDNMLLITNDGRKLALDQRLINPMLPADPESKAVKCAETVFDIWRRTAEKHSTQMIFCDLSTPKSEGVFSVYDDIRSKLVEMGVPENEIAYIHDAKTETQKKDLFAKVRAGQVRVLLGSTQRMGAGTNCQQKLVALHHLDCPWRPADLQQREGRIIRQGNENAEVDIYSYVTEGTFDAYLYQLVERKQKFIAQIMTSKSPVRSAEDVDEQALSYAEIKALASGNLLIKEKMDLDIEVTKLKLLKSSHLSQRYSMEDAISKTFPKSIAETQERLAGYGADIAAVKAHTAPNEDGFSPMTLAGKVYTEKKAAGAELLLLCQNMLTPEAMQIGSYRGLTLELSFDSFSQEYRLTMIGQLRHVVTLGTDVFGNIQRMDNLLESLPLKEQACREKLSDLHNQLETAKVEVLKPFPREEELQTKLARLEELNALLNMDKREPEIVAETEAPDNSQQPLKRKTTELER